MKRIILCLLFAVIISSSISAQTHKHPHKHFHKQKVKKNHSLCDTLIIMQDIITCLDKEFKEADSLMMEKYNSVIKKIDNKLLELKHQNATERIMHITNQKEVFIASQEQWLKYRKANADIYRTTYKGGKVLQLVVYNTKINDTNQRIEKLNEFYKLLGN